MYAIVDIETTGGFADNHGITEIAVALHDGKKLTGFYESLVNPQKPIPRFISGLTGITSEMLTDAPLFPEIAPKIYSLLQDRIFVAHNVNFDYSFVQKALQDAGFNYQAKRLCTVRMSRKIFPGFKSYSLGNLARQLSVKLDNAHRAGPDCLATAEILGLLVKNDKEKHIATTLKRTAGELNLPPNLHKDVFIALPEEAGVYYFHDERKVIYVGKAKKIKSRVASHFSGKSGGEKKQGFLREIHDVSYELCGNELVALLHEAQEIRKHWPRYNKAQKSLDFRFGIYLFEDGRGIQNLAIDKARKYFSPLISFPNMWEARGYMDQLVGKYGLNKACCGLEAVKSVNGTLVPIQKPETSEEIKEYNRLVQQAVDEISAGKETFAVVGKGRKEEEHSLVMVDGGRYCGFGFFEKDTGISTKDEALNLIKPAKDVNESYWLIRSFVQKDIQSRVLKFN